MTLGSDMTDSDRVGHVPDPSNPVSFHLSLDSLLCVEGGIPHFIPCRDYPPLLAHFSFFKLSD